MEGGEQVHYRREKERMEEDCKDKIRMCGRIEAIREGVRMEK